MRPLIDYGDIIYDNPQYESFCEKLKCIQYKAVLAITGSIQVSSHEKNYQELRPESLQSRRWYSRLSCMFKIMKEKTPNYLKFLIPISQSIRTRKNRVSTFDC